MHDVCVHSDSARLPACRDVFPYDHMYIDVGLCVCVCVCVCVYVCMYVCIYLYLYIYISIWKHI